MTILVSERADEKEVFCMDSGSIEDILPLCFGERFALSHWRGCRGDLN